MCVKINLENREKEKFQWLWLFKKKRVLQMAPVSLRKSVGERLFLESEQRASRTQVSWGQAARKGQPQRESWAPAAEGRMRLSLVLTDSMQLSLWPCGCFKDLKCRRYIKEPWPWKGIKGKCVWLSAACWRKGKEANRPGELQSS